MKVGALRRALEGIDDDTDVIVRADDGDDLIICGLKSASLQYDCDDESYFALDGDDEPEDEPAKLLLIN